jgi:hypothetical protein
MADEGDYVIQILDRGLAGAYITEFTAEDGLEVTSLVEQAKRFATNLEAMEFWRQELPQGVQGDNPARPNRPLTAFTVNIHRASQAT